MLARCSIPSRGSRLLAALITADIAIVALDLRDSLHLDPHSAAPRDYGPTGVGF